MNRISNFLYNINWLSEITGNRILSVLYLIQFKISKSAVAQGTCGKTKFYFRKPDLSGVQEILIAKEYEFLAPAITSKPDFTILDCGAHIGLPILWALTINLSLRALSVEASPDTFQILDKNRDSANANWKVINRACWSDETEITFSTRGDSMSHRASKDGALKVRGISLPDLITLFSPNKNIDLMKVDIEGAEEEFLCGNEAWLEKVNSIVIELHPKLCNTNKVEDVLKKHFAHIETIQGRTSSKPLLYCRK